MEESIKQVYIKYLKNQIDVLSYINKKMNSFYNPDHTIKWLEERSKIFDFMAKHKA